MLPKIWVFSTEPVAVNVHNRRVGFANTVCCTDVIVLCLSWYGWSLVCM